MPVSKVRKKSLPRRPDPRGKRVPVPVGEGDEPRIDLPQRTIDWIGDGCVEKAGLVNGYTCRKCGRMAITRLLHTGATSSQIGCRMTPGCDGSAHSAWYRQPPGPPTFEWYRPSRVEYVRLPPWEREHVSGGGLLLREV